MRVPELDKRMATQPAPGGIADDTWPGKSAFETMFPVTAE